MGLLQTLRKWFKSETGDAETVAEAKRIEQEKITVRVSQTGRQPFAGIPPLPDVLDPDREHR